MCLKKPQSAAIDLWFSFLSYKWAYFKSNNFRYDGLKFHQNQFSRLGGHHEIRVTYSIYIGTSKNSKNIL